MKKNKINRFVVVTISLLVVLLTFGCVTTDSAHWQKDNDYHLTILHTNDHHGRFWKNKHGEYGMAARKTLVDQIRQEVKAQGGSVFLFSGGDINTGVPESDLQDAEPDFKGMNLLGYDAMAVGNHEFDNPLAVLMKQRDWAKFPLLSANIYDEKTHQRLFKPYQIFYRQGIKIAVIGLTTEDTAKIGNPEFVSQIKFTDPKKEAKKLIKALRKTEKPDVVLAITHMGHYQNAEHSIKAPGDVSLARFLDQGQLDMIIGGHSQNPVCMTADHKRYDPQFEAGKACHPDKQNGTWIVQAHEWGEYVGRADFTFRNGKLHLDKYALIPVNLKKEIESQGKSQRVLIGKEIAEDPRMIDFLTPYQAKGQKALSTVIGHINGKLDASREKVRFQQTNLGKLLAWVQKESVKADFGIMNGGGIRDSIEAGPVTYKDILKVQPFANTITYVDMNGKELLDYLNVVAKIPVDTGGYAHFAGIRIVMDDQDIRQILINGQPLKEDKMYRFSVSSFNAAGGDGYPNITKHPNFVNTGFIDAQVFRDYLEKHSPLDVFNLPE